MTVRLDVVHGDVLKFSSDVLILKYAQQAYGVDAKVIGSFAANGVDLQARLPKPGESLIVDSHQLVAARHVLFIGVAPAGSFNYETVREFASSALSVLGRHTPEIGHVAMTLHGTGFGLDEAEAFRAQVGGVLDAIAARAQPAQLAHVSIVDWNADTARRLKDVLNAILPSGTVSEERRGHAGEPATLSGARASLVSVGRKSREKPHIFVAMPFAEEYSDRFHYGIKGAAHAAGFLCERADLATFTGDVLAWVKERIDTAALVVADLSSGNPNVYLEVGYAWGRGVDTVLIVAAGETLEFDVRAQRCLVFRSIHHLEELLTQELRSIAHRLAPDVT